MDSKIKNRLLNNSFWNFYSLGFSRFGSLIFTIILIRFLLPEGYGVYSIVTSTALILYNFAELGINHALIRYLSYSLAKNPKKLNSYYRYLLKLRFFAILILSFTLLILSYPLAYYIFDNPSMFVPFLISSFYIFISSFESFYSSIFYAVEKLNYLGIKETLNQFLRIALAFCLFYLVASSFYISGILIVITLVSLVMFLFSLFYTKKIIPQLYAKNSSTINQKKVVKFAGYLTIASISSAFFSYIDSIMLGLFLAPEYVGYYKSAFSLVFGVIGLLSFQNILLPFFTKLKGYNTQNIFGKVFYFMAMISLPATFGLLALGKYFIVAFFGESYLPATTPLYFLAFLIFPSITLSLFLSYFSAEEKPEIFAKLVLISSIINIILNIILIKSLSLISPIFGTAGAGIATLFSWVFYFSFASIILKNKFKISTPFKSLIKPLISSIIMFLAISFTLKFISDMNLIVGIAEVLFGILIYFLVLFLIKGIEKKDVFLILSLMKLKKLY